MNNPCSSYKVSTGNYISLKWQEIKSLSAVGGLTQTASISNVARPD